MHVRASHSGHSQCSCGARQDMGVMGMRVGEKRKLEIPSEEAYGDKGLTEWGVPPNAPLTCVV